MAKKEKNVEKTYERRIEAVITFVDGEAESITKGNIAEILKNMLNCDDIQVKSVKTYEHEK